MRAFTATLVAATVIASVPAWAELRLTPSQAEGPFYPSTRMRPVEVDNDLTRIEATGATAKGQVLVLKGTVVAPTGQPIPGARIEIWQTDHQGIYLHPGDGNTARRDRGFQFYGVATAAMDGSFTFKTIVPALYPGRARHIHAKVTPPGGQTLTTQLYFKTDPTLSRDGLARGAGDGLADITLDPQPAGQDGTLEASVRLVVRPRS